MKSFYLFIQSVILIILAVNANCYTFSYRIFFFFFFFILYLVNRLVALFIAPCCLTALGYWFTKKIMLVANTKCILKCSMIERKTRQTLFEGHAWTSLLAYVPLLPMAQFSRGPVYIDWELGQYFQTDLSQWQQLSLHFNRHERDTSQLVIQLI